MLDEHGDPVQEHDLEAWSRWFAQADRSVARSVVSSDVTVLTTFNGVDDVPEPDCVPKLFESRVFGGVLDGAVVQHCTRAEATAQHHELVEWCRIGSQPNVGLSDADLL